MSSDLHNSLLSVLFSATVFISSHLRKTTKNKIPTSFSIFLFFLTTTKIDIYYVHISLLSVLFFTNKVSACSLFRFTTHTHQPRQNFIFFSSSILLFLHQTITNKVSACSLFRQTSKKNTPTLSFFPFLLSFLQLPTLIHAFLTKKFGNKAFDSVSFFSRPPQLAQNTTKLPKS